MHSSKRLTAVVAAAAAALAIGGLAATPAAASNSYNGAYYIGGAGDPYDDFWDEGILSMTSNANSNATCLWQKILWAEELLDWNQIDGIFGKDTRDATITLQKRTHRTPDGLVGQETFKAVNSPADTDGDGAADTYMGSTYAHSFNLWRNSEGHYDFYDDGVVKSAGYNYNTCS